ncbi:amidohydrolase [Nocardioidaceae bacterium SCSIO 66511]|nr:amidohydrolase [Nocardioidaceae bacterium SCSIO 66511]
MAAVLFRHPVIHTFDGSGGPVDAILTVDGTITAIGEYARLREQAPTGTRTEDLPGAAVVAGFHDAHIHSATFARELDALDLRGVADLDEALDRLRAYLDAHPGDDWMFGGRWDSNTWAVPVQPNRRDLDRVSPVRPVALSSIDGHTVWVNSAALRSAGINSTTPDPAGGEIVRDSDGIPTGILREAALDLLDHVPGAADRRDVEALLTNAQHRLLSYGITHITDLDGEEVRDAYLTMRDRGTLALRVHKGIPVSALDKAVVDGRRTGDGDAWFTTGPVKIFADGALGSHTAHMGAGFTGDSDNHGIAVLSYDELQELVEKATANRIAVATHAIGDEANRLVLDAYEAVRGLTQRHGLRHRIEHAQHLRPEDVARLAALGVIPSSQPTHCTTDFRLAGRLLAGRDLANYPWRAFADAGAHLAFGSDSPVEPAEPMYGIHAAVTRQNRAGEPAGGWEPHQRLTVGEALLAYSFGGAYAAGIDDRVGRIAPGQYADFVALERDPVTEPATDLHRIEVLSTVVGGEVRYAR